MVNNEFITQKKVSIIFALIIILVGTIYYFTSGAYLRSSMSNSPLSKETLDLLNSVELKAAYTDEGKIDMFALAKNNTLTSIAAKKGKSIPEIGGIVLGNVEGSMMLKEDEFKNIGDTLIDYDITFRVDGILSKTNTFADDFHFINAQQYTKLNAESNVLFVKFKDPQTPKLFYLYNKDSKAPVSIKLAEGNMNLYYKHVIGKKIYYPLILGFDEAKMMREEKLFTKTGDTLDGFFGRDIIIIGILEKSDSSLDMMHVVEKDFFDTSVKVELL